MKNLLRSFVVLFVVMLSACAAGPGTKAALVATDPTAPAVAALDINDFKPQSAIFSLRIKEFEIRNGTWNAANDDSVVELERNAIQQLEQAGYAYTPNPEQAQYNIEFHLTCYDPSGASQASEGLGAFPDDGFWGPYAVNERTYVFNITSGAPAQNGPPHCSGRMLILVRDREAGTPHKVYAGKHSLSFCSYTQGCSFSACQDQQKNAVLNYLDIVFPE
jgi:hypothetical protein